MLWKCNKIFEDTLSLCVTRSGASMPATANAMSAKQEPAVPQCLLNLLSHYHNLPHVFESYTIIYYHSRIADCVQQALFSFHL